METIYIYIYIFVYNSSFWKRCVTLTIEKSWWESSSKIEDWGGGLIWNAGIVRRSIKTPICMEDSIPWDKWWRDFEAYSHILRYLGYIAQQKEGKELSNLWDHYAYRKAKQLLWGEKLYECTTHRWWWLLSCLSRFHPTLQRFYRVSLLRGLS